MSGKVKNGRRWFISTCWIVAGIVAFRASNSILTADGAGFANALILLPIGVLLLGGLAFLIGYALGDKESDLPPTRNTSAHPPGQLPEPNPYSPLPPPLPQRSSPPEPAPSHVRQPGQSKSRNNAFIFTMIGLAFVVVAFVAGIKLGDSQGRQQESASIARADAAMDAAFSAHQEKVSSAHASAEASQLAPNARPPKFVNYPAPSTYNGQRAPAILASEFDRVFRTRIKNTERLPVNFAGEYVLSYWGCGADCLMGAAVNARTGTVISLPGSICCWDGSGEKIIYRPDSRLVILAGLINESGAHGAHFYEVKDGKFRHIHSEPVERKAEETVASQLVDRPVIDAGRKTESDNPPTSAWPWTNPITGRETFIGSDWQYVTSEQKEHGKIFIHFVLKGTSTKIQITAIPISSLSNFGFDLSTVRNFDINNVNLHPSVTIHYDKRWKSTEMVGQVYEYAVSDSRIHITTWQLVSGEYSWSIDCSQSMPASHTRECEIMLAPLLYSISP